MITIQNCMIGLLPEVLYSRFNLELDSESPSSLGIYIGWKIVKSFMKNNDIKLANMLQSDSQYIFKNAKFKPKK